MEFAARLGSASLLIPKRFPRWHLRILARFKWSFEGFNFRGLCSCFFHFSHLFLGKKRGNNEGISGRAGTAMTSCHPSSLHGDIPVFSIPLSLSSPSCSPSPLPLGTSQLQVISFLGRGEFQDLIYPWKLSAGLQEREKLFLTPLHPLFHQAWNDNSKIVIC